MVFIAWIWIVAFRVHPGTYEAQAQLANRDRLHAGRTISATRPRMSIVWVWRALACPQDANSTIVEMALGAALPFGRGCWPPL
jgi:hypothetical protein